MLTEGVIADVSAVFEELVEVLRRESVPARRADPGGVESVGDLLHRDTAGVVADDLSDDRSRLRIRHVALLAVHGEAEDLVPVAQGSLGVVALAAPGAG